MNTFCLQITGDDYMPVYLAIQQLIKYTHINNVNENENENEILVLPAKQARPLKQYMETKPDKRLSHKECITLIHNLSIQIHHLRKLGFGIYGFNIHDILLIDDTFVICSTQHVLPLYNDMFIFTSLFDVPIFSNPEVNQLTSLPSRIHYKCSYYSLGIFVVYCLLLSTTNDVSNLDTLLRPIYHTKMYWFLQRCFQKDIHQRTLLLI